MNQGSDENAELIWLSCYFQARGSGLTSTRTDDAGAVDDASLEAESRWHRARRWIRILDHCFQGDDGPTWEDRNLTSCPPVSHPEGLLPKRLGQFEIVRLLGSGGGGVVFLARDPRLNRLVALKVPRPEYLLTADHRRRFLREAQSIAALQHPYLATVYEAGEVGSICFIATEYCSGPSLAEWMRDQTSPVPLSIAVNLTSLLCEAVHYVHQCGVLHRDIKPGNVLLQSLEGAPRRGSLASAQTIGFLPRLTDFGLARPLHSDGGNLDALAGTPSYMAPEQAVGSNEEIGIATDVYGLGALLYHLLTGQPPFRGDNDAATRKLVAAHCLIPPRLLRPEVPRELEAICLKCLALEPSDRYTSAEEIREELERFLQGKPIVALRYWRIHKFAKSCRRHPTIAALVTALAVTLMIAWGGLWQMYASARHHRQQAEVNFLKALAAVDQFSAIRESAIQDLPGVEPLQQRMDETALSYYEDFVRKQGEREPRLMRSVARAHYRIGQLRGGSGAWQEAYTALQKALRIQVQCVTQAPSDHQQARELADTLYAIGCLEFDRGESEAGLASHQRALELRARLVSQSPANPVYLRELAEGYSRVGLHFVGQRQHAAAIDQLSRAETLWRQLLEYEPNDIKVRLGLAITLNRIGMAWGFNKDSAAAVPYDEEAVQLLEALVAEYPVVNSFRRELASCYANLGRWHARNDRIASEINHRRAIVMRESLVKLNPDAISYQDDLAESLWIFGAFLGRRRRYEEAIAILERGERLLEDLQRKMPDYVKHQRRLSECSAALTEVRNDWMRQTGG